MLLEIKNLSVNYDHIQALDDVSFNIEEGSVVSIIGANGAGKSTLLSAISGTVKRGSGQILFDGKQLPTAPHKVVREGVVHVPEGRHVFVGLTVTENLIMGGIRTTKAETATNIKKMFELFPILGERREQMAGTLSGGEQQMLATARGLMSNPRLLLLDEPSLGLAPLIVNQIFDIIKEINSRGMTILLVEQNAQKALSISNYTYVLQTGHVQSEGPSSELLGNNEFRKAYLGE